jgi:tetratricopeptide (TPR) repeat protein
MGDRLGPRRLPGVMRAGSQVAVAASVVVRALRRLGRSQDPARPPVTDPARTKGSEPHRDADRPDVSDPAAHSPGLEVLEGLPLPAIGRRWLRARWVRLTLLVPVGLALFSLLADTLGIVSFFGAGRSSSGTGQVVPPRMKGDFNVAVAKFSVVSAIDSALPEIEGFEETLAERISTSLSDLQPSVVEVWPPDWTGDLADPSPEVRANKMRERAVAIHADVIVSGVVQPTGRGITVSPELYLSERQLPNAWELVGRHEFPGVTRSAIPSPFSGAFRSDLRSEVTKRAHGLTQFVAGLSAYAAGDYRQALRHFTAARGDWDTIEGRAMLELFLGNVAGKTGDHAAAERHYAEAARARPGDGRALLGLAERDYHQARGACERDSGVDRRGLAEALRRYAAAALATHRPAGADIESKAALGQGRVYLCLSQAEAADDWARAEAQFLTVVRAYEAGNQRIRPLAVEAYAGLGLVYLPPEGAVKAVGAYRRAAAAYERAINLSDVPERQGVFFGVLGHVYGRLGERDRAADAYGKAAELDPAHADDYRRAARAVRQTA